MSSITKFGYKNYHGQFFPRSYRIWQISLFNLKERIWNQRSVIAIYTILLFIAFMVLIPIAFIASAGNGIFGNLGQFANVDKITFFSTAFGIITFTLVSNPLTFILYGFIGGKIISEDIEYKSMEQYFLRVRKLDYLFGKFIALLLSYFLSIFSIVFVFYYFLTSAFGYGLFDFDPLIVLIKIIFYLLIISGTLTLFMLAISGATEKKNYSTLVFILILLVIGDIIRVFAVFLDSQTYLLFNPQALMAALLTGLVPISQDLQNILGFLSIGGGSIVSSLNFTQALYMMILVSLGSLVYVTRKIENIWS